MAKEPKAAVKPKVKPRIPIPVKTKEAKAQIYMKKIVKDANFFIGLLVARGEDIPLIGDKREVAALSSSSVGIKSDGNAYIFRVEGATVSVTVNKKRYVLG